tara:strand:- start:506 stop:802 length:297 start_codon:yes stop_codon:yes gene_type:complete
MPKLLLVIFSILVFFIAMFIILIYKDKYNLSKKIKSFSPLILTPNVQENNPDINTKNWYLHKVRLFKFGRSQYKGLTFYVSSEDRIYYLSEEGNKVYC